MSFTFLNIRSAYWVRSFLLGGLLVSSAAFADDGSHGNLDYTSWRLVQVQTPSKTIRLDSDLSKDTIGFDQPPGAMKSQDGQELNMVAFGNSYCGAFKGSASESGDRLNFSGLEPDPIKCTKQDVRKEKHYLRALRHVQTFLIDDSGDLQMTEDDGTVLTFIPIQ